MNLDPLNGSATEIMRLVRSRQISARDIVRLSVERISAVDEVVNAFTDVTAERAFAEADIVDAKVQAGEAPRLAGIPYAVKNLFDLEGVVTRAGSMINRSNPPATEDATLVARLREEGALCLGALNMGEYAYDFTGQNAHDGNCNNPHDLSRITGGSSSGSGAAVAAGLAPVSLGSDTNGSIRVPASFCGTFGLKPTFGRLSRAKTYPFTASLDHLGPLARTTEDLALFYDVMQGLDPFDHAQARRSPEAALPEIDKGVAGLRIAVAGGYFRDKGFPEADAAVDVVAKALGVSDTVEIPEAARARAAAYVITNAESAALHLPRLQARAADFDPETRDRFLAGTMVPGGWYIASQRFRSWYRAAVNALFDEVDVILAPSTPFTALKATQKTMIVGGEEVPARANIGIFTQPISFAGLPVVSVPVWLDGSRLPIGVQVIAAPWREDIALRVSAYLENAGVVKAPVAMVSA